ncbi:MAG: hypothetical protein DMG68_04230 [Acidobacteria bacterium]|jgi:hypothetical protein|nr:MAG: hypothetical protein DMG68_04230 [Acidobacteriota bacterium]
MTKQETSLCERLKLLGYAQNKQMRIYGQVFEVLSDPVMVGDHLVFVDAIERKSGAARRVFIPLTTLHMVQRELRAA